jgi:hypothetical protein
VIKSRRMIWGHVARMGDMRNAYRILVWKPEGKRPHGWTRRRCEDGIRMDCKEVGWEGVDWIHLVQDKDQWWALVNIVINLRVPYKAGNFLTSWVTLNLSRRTLLRGVS